MSIKDLQQALYACRHCCTLFGFEPRPMVWGNAPAPIMLIGQAPSRKVHETGIPFNDASGKRLRKWLAVTESQFWNQNLFYITAAGHCYPGKSAKKGGGDLPPPKVCAEMWLSQELALKQVKLYIFIGSHATRYCFGNKFKLSQLVFEELSYRGKPAFVLPHPSPLNMRWFKDHPGFEHQIVPGLQQAVGQLI